VSSEMFKMQYLPVSSNNLLGAMPFQLRCAAQVSPEERCRDQSPIIRQGIPHAHVEL